MCYYCTGTFHNEVGVLTHSANLHDGTKNFSLRSRQLDSETGKVVYKSIHYGLTIDALIETKTSGKLTFSEGRICVLQNENTTKPQPDSRQFLLHKRRIYLYPTFTQVI
jgi:hypothetical protein